MDNVTELRERLGLLERRLKRLQLALGTILIALAATVLMAQRHANRVVTANEFILQDSTGQTRAKLAVLNESTQLVLLDRRGHQRAKLSESLEVLPISRAGASLELNTGAGRGISLFTGSGNTLAFTGGNDIEMVLSGGTPGTLLEPSFILRSNGKHISFDTKFPNIEVTDAEGFQTQIGSVKLVTPQTGSTQRTSASAVTLFTKDGTVLWSTPR